MQERCIQKLCICKVCIFHLVRAKDFLYYTGI